MGCQIDSLFTIEIGECPLIIPTAFSPNGDLVNDYFTLNTPSNSFAILEEINIYNRWGILIVEEKNISLNSFTWDGTQNGNKMEVGVYVYYALVRFSNGKTDLFKGNISLIR